MYKRRITLTGVLIFAGCMLLVLSGCQKDESTIVKEKVTGSVQKGPFVNGTSILMSELSATLQQTGKSFNSQILNNAGTFEIPDVALSSSFVEFSANGYYYDEIKGEVSVSPLILLALSDITDISTVNINILTHLEKQRVEYLVGQGVSFSTAKSTSQGEILAIFGFSLSGMESSEKLDISVNSTGNAILLAISAILQGDRSVGDMTELMANIINDIREDGIVDDEDIIAELRSSAARLPLSAIRSNIAGRYQELGISASIAGFEEYVNDFLEFTGDKPTILSQTATKIYTVSATLNGVICPNSISTDVVFQYGMTDAYGSTVSAVQNPLNAYYNEEVSADITGLIPLTTYHYRICATSIKGVVYGPDQTFMTSDPVNIAVDPDGYKYRSVVIGDQVWMAENLKTTKYSDGSPIPKIVNENEWPTLTSPAYCWCENDSATNYNDYGALYNFYTVNTGKLCPDGWHVPNADEWATLANTLGGWRVAGGKMKETGYVHWNEPNTGATNETGFTALPHGIRNPEIGIFGGKGNGTQLWSSSVSGSVAIVRGMDYGAAILGTGTAPFRLGASVRCVKD